MNNELTTGGIFDYGRLDRSNYTLTLASEALRCGLCTGEQYNAMQAQLYERLGKQIYLYTNGLSVSIENRTGAQLLSSILYNLDITLMRMTPDVAVQKLFGSRLDDILGEGMRLNREYTLKALSMLRTAVRTRIETVCIFYNRLLNGSARQLIRSNDIAFDAARVLTLVDYPMPTVNRSAKGICGMLHMLEELLCENKLVCSFDFTERDMLFARFERELTDPTAAGLNLGQLCFEQAILCMMAGKPAGSLLLWQNDCAELAERYDAESAYESAVGCIHRLADRAPERYLMRLLAKSRVTLSTLFAGGETALRRFAGLTQRSS